MTYRTLLLTSLAMLAFAGNSLLCRLALRDTAIDPASFTAIRLSSGALVLWLLLQLGSKRLVLQGSWPAALALFVYAAAFSLAYLHLDAGVGALILFGSVQLSMSAWGLLKGERLNLVQSFGLSLAALGLVLWLLPGSQAPALSGTLLMILAGLAWAGYSLLGRGAGDPLANTAGNFLRAVPLALMMLLGFAGNWQLDGPGVVYAVLSGALTSGVGYAIWYAALKHLSAIQGASVQLSVPVIAALLGSLLLAESISLRLSLVTVMTIGGIGLVLRGKRNGTAAK
ncbi:DMT family transporter [Pseudomonas sp.]|uniref:DMT family transporter n=1 Tax=Pseudomonas sp. TaxID=306 RepID=UPI00272CC442|nr:DMT family transporter [Pseudomonas sp.]